MRSFVIVVIFLVFGSLPPTRGEEDLQFNCKPKPGCDFSKCDPVPSFYFEIDGFDAEEYRRRNNYHITCEPNFDLIKGIKSVKGEKGIAGPKGDKGEEGPKGPPAEKGERGRPGLVGQMCPPGIGQIDVELVKILVENEVKKATTTVFAELREEMNSRIDEIAKQLNSSATRRATGSKENVSCSVKYNGKCFWAKAREKWSVTYAHGNDLCRADSAIPANIYSEDHYNLVMNYLRSLFNSTTNLNVWTGMTYEGSNNSVTLSKGTAATPYVKWIRGHPKPGNNGKIVLRVEAVKTSIYQGMFHQPRNAQRDGVLCQNE